MPNLIIFPIWLAIATALNGQQAADHFSANLSTTASPEKIWQIWTDVPQWHQWDSGLKSARIKGDFSKGTKGKLKPDKGPASTFRIVEFTDGQSYTFATGLPFGRLYVKRYLSVCGTTTCFTHEVWFTGPLKKWYARKLGVRYQEILPQVLQNIKTIAEKP